MDPRQLQSYEESILYCQQLISMLEREKDTIRSCFKGDPLKAYLEATDEAIRRVKSVRNSLQQLQAMQQ